MKHLLTFTAHGVPAPQGSKKAIPAKNGAGEYTGKVSVLESSAKLKPWRQIVAAAARRAHAGPKFDGPVIMTLEFRLPRPKGHYGTGRNAGRLKPSAPEHHLVKPDVDKLERGILDALKMAGVYGDDSQVVSVTSFKRYADHAAPGVTVTAMTPAHEPPATAGSAASASAAQVHTRAARGAHSGAREARSMIDRDLPGQDELRRRLEWQAMTPSQRLEANRQAIADELARGPFIRTPGNPDERKAP